MTFYTVSEDPKDMVHKQKVPLLYFVSFVMVFAQCATVVAVIVGTWTPACLTNDQCGSGMFCSVGVSDRCQYCGSHAPGIVQYGENGETYNAVFDGRFAGFNSSFVAELCADPIYVPTVHNLCKDENHPVWFRGQNVPCGEAWRNVAKFVGADKLKIPSGGLRLSYTNVGDWEYPITITAITNWCDECFFPSTGYVDSVTMASLVADNIHGMGLFVSQRKCQSLTRHGFTVPSESFVDRPANSTPVLGTGLGCLRFCDFCCFLSDRRRDERHRAVHARAQPCNRT